MKQETGTEERSEEEGAKKKPGKILIQQSVALFPVAKHVNSSNHQCGQEELSNDQHPFSTDSDKPTNRQSKNVLNHKIDHQINEFTDKETHNMTD